MSIRKQFSERNLEPEHAAFLIRRFDAWAIEQPKAIELRKLLLNIDGCEIVAPPNQWEPDMAALIERGSLIELAHRTESMDDNGCHQNSAILFQRERAEGFGIGTGWALSNDLWRQHSWCVSGSILVETTVLADRYFGIILRATEAENFCQKVLG